tara:strand:- start:2074 stop:3357 length:1284 start_codon:yes stop_codon:yes gene_type:complete
MKSLGLALCLAVCGCSVTSKETDHVGLKATDFIYQTPMTVAALKGQAVLVDCDDKSLTVSLSLNIVSKVIGDPHGIFVLPASSLESFSQKQSLDVELYDNHTIKAINTTSSDKTATIVTNVFKGLATIFKLGTMGAAFPAPGVDNRTLCNDKTIDALADVDLAETNISTAWDQLSSASGPDAEGLKAKIDALASRRADLISRLLTKDISEKLAIPTSSPGALSDKKSIVLTGEDFANWVKSPNDDAIIRLGYTLTGPSVEGEIASTSPCLKSRAADPNRPAHCASSIVLSNPVEASIIITADAGNIQNVETGDVLGSETLVVPQWGAVSYLPLNVGFGSSRTVKMALDAYGRKQSFSWSSDATGETITGGAVSMLDAASGAVNASRPPSEQESMAAEIAEIKARIELDQLRKCELIRDSGGTDCSGL